MRNDRREKHIGCYIVVGIIVAIILAIGIFLLIDYSHYARDKSPYRTFIKPRLEIGSFRITDLTIHKTGLMAAMLIHNPLPFNISADSMQYRIFINGTQVMKSTYSHSLDILKWDSTWINLPATAYTDQLVNILTSAEKRGDDSADYEVATSMGTNLIIHKHLNLDIKTRQPLIYIPQIKLEKIIYDSLDFKGVRLYLYATVDNKNVFPLDFKNLDFRMAIAGYTWVKGHKSGVTKIPGRSVANLELPLYISFKNMGKSLGPLIRSGKNTPFKFELTLNLVSNDKAVKNSLIVLKDTSTISKMVQLAKKEKAKTKQKEQKEKAANPLAYKEKKKRRKLNKVKVEKLRIKA